MRWFLPLLLGCAPTGDDTAPAPADCAATGQSYIGVVSVLTWARVADDGTSPGFDLDGRTSTENDALGCGITDYVGVDGTPGVDNGMGRLLPTLELTEFQAVEGLVAQTIASGGFLLTFRLDGVDDPANDACVDLTVGRAEGDVLLGTDGLLEVGQTVDRDEDAEELVFRGLQMTDGHLQAQPLDLSVPLQVFEVSLDFDLTGGALSVDLADDGHLSGVFGGGVDTAYIMSIATNEDVDADLVDLMGTLLSLYADLQPNDAGTCDQLSVNFEYEAIPAWFFDEGEG